MKTSVTASSARHVNVISFSGMFLFAAGLLILSPLLSSIARTYNLDLAQAGLVYSASYIGFTLFQFLGGSLADKWGKKIVLSLSLFGMGVSLALLPLSGSLFLLFVSLFFFGGFGGIVETITGALVAEANPQKSAFAMNLIHVIFGVGAVLGPIGAGFVLQTGLNWQLCFYALAVPVFVLAIASIPMQVPHGAVATRVTFHEFKAIMKDSGFLFICLAMMLYTGTEVGVWGWISTFLKEYLHFEAFKASLSVGIFWIGMILGRLICGLLVGKLGTRRLVVIIASLSTIAAAASGWMLFEPLVWIIIFLLGFTFSSQFPLIVSYGGEYTRTTSGMIFSMLVASGSLGTIVIPYLMGLLAAWVGPNITLSVMCIPFACVAFIMYQHGKRKQGFVKQ